MSLLPVDPPAFTIPSTASSPSAAQPTVSLTDYPLPDGTWRWVSRAWMIDMHGDGQVQYDGFEYNWFFRSKNWRPEVGFMSAGGFVRRRRWLRLMMRPAQVREGANGAATPDGLLEVPLLEHHEGASRPPSVTLSAAADDTNSPAEIWKGDEGDWNRCHAALKRLRRDGRKLELWQRWLGVMLPRSSANSVAEKGEDQEKRPQLSTNDSRSSSHTSQDGTLAADSGARTNQAPVKCISTVIRAHVSVRFPSQYVQSNVQFNLFHPLLQGSDILQLFIYPDSRAKFLDILARSGLLPELQAGLGVSKSMHVLDFWSYTQCLTDGSTNSDDV
ncbi:hypothetical protein A0H81_01126 [Grifola frondosa]|uniref:TECPR1-like DysF domain-containing protein n=1 Tax=Grifola frondosa TaxID=5627 RepID=A0A1C7MRF0_GRIFR|nr:hypothetical protein A0H81_01126 [Grifola frondosa]